MERHRHQLKFLDENFLIRETYAYGLSILYMVLYAQENQIYRTTQTTTTTAITKKEKEQTL